MNKRTAVIFLSAVILGLIIGNATGNMTFGIVIIFGVALFALMLDPIRASWRKDWEREQKKQPAAPPAQEYQPRHQQTPQPGRQHQRRNTR